MKRSEANYELQSRREFFKKAAQSTLPVIALTALGGLLGACEKDDPEGMDDEGSSSGGSSRCPGSCTANCRNACKGNAYWFPASCNGTCKGACMSGCKTACIGSAKHYV